jgi:hypothetical protein
MAKKKSARKSKTARKPTVKEVPRRKEFETCGYCGERLKPWQYEYCPACRRMLKFSID